MLRLRHQFGRQITARFASYDADLTVVGAGPGGYVAAIKARATKIFKGTSDIEKFVSDSFFNCLYRFPDPLNPENALLKNLISNDFFNF